MAFVDEEQSGLHPRDGEAPPVLPDGSYVFAPRRLAVPGADGADAPTPNPGEVGMRFEACLQLHGDREGTGGAPQEAFSQARATRVRVVLLGGPGDGHAWDLRRVEVCCSLLWRSLSCRQALACMGCCAATCACSCHSSHVTTPFAVAVQGLAATTAVLQ